MKYFIYCLVITGLCSCGNNKPAEQVPVTAKTDSTPASFFRVTSFVKGQIFELKKYGDIPLRFVTQNNKVDSAWLKPENFETAFAEFLTPVIDSSNLTELFSEEKFNDQTVNSITLTYAPKKILPAGMDLKRWDVYLEPQTAKVQRLYLEKSRNDTLKQLTWLTNNWCSINTLVPGADGKTVLIREEKIIWKF